MKECRGEDNFALEAEKQMQRYNFQLFIMKNVQAYIKANRILYQSLFKTPSKVFCSNFDFCNISDSYNNTHLSKLATADYFNISL